MNSMIAFAVQALRGWQPGETGTPKSTSFAEVPVNILWGFDQKVNDPEQKGTGQSTKVFHAFAGTARTDTLPAREQGERTADPYCNYARFAS